jgi:integrase
MGANQDGDHHVSQVQVAALAHQANEQPRATNGGAMSEQQEKKKKPQRPKGTGCIYTPNGSRYLWIKYKSGGKVRAESSKSTEWSVAQDLLSSRLGDVSRGIVVTPKAGRIKLWEGLKAVIDDLTNNGRKNVEYTQARHDMHLLKYFEANRLMNSISMADINAYKAHRLGQDAKPATVNRELASLRRAFRLAQRGGDLISIPHVGLLKENNIRQGFFERDQFDELLKHMPAELRALLEFAYITGWRKSEVLSLKVSQVDMKVGVVRLEVGTTKSGRGRSFYVTKELREVLQGQLDSIDALKKKQDIITPYVFHWLTRPRCKPGSRIKEFRTAWEDACKAAGCPGKLFHDFRRTAVRNLERAGVPRSTAMAMVGHETESIYRRYAIVDEAMHREAAVMLDDWRSQDGKQPSSGKVKQFKRR